MGRLPLSAMPHRLLESPQRRAILRLATESPGISFGELKACTGLGWGTLYHHVTAMHRANLVQTRVVHRRRILLPLHAHAIERVAIANAILRGGTARLVAQFAASRGPTDVAEMTRELGVGPRAVYYHVKRLVEAELLVCDRGDRRLIIRATDTLIQALRDGSRTG